MKYTGPIYRPPYDANTLLLQVTVGCAHNKCAFCTMYRDVKFSIEKLDGIANASDTAKLINAVKPYGIVPTTLGAFGNSELARMVDAGHFTPAPESEVIEEQKKLIDMVEVETKYMGIHALNTLNFDAVLPRDKENVQAMIDQRLKKMNSDYLQGVPERQSV